MADYVEKWGDDVDSAVELALKDLKLSRDQVNVIVLEQPSKGFLGLFKNKLAKVRVEKKSDELKEMAQTLSEKAELKKAKSEKKNFKSDQDVRKSLEEEKISEKQADSYVISEDKESEISEKNSAAEVKVKEEAKASSKQSAKASSSKKYSRASQMQTKFTITDEDTDAVPAQDEPSVKFIEEIASNMGISIDVKASIKNDTIYINLEGKDVGSMIGKRGQTLDAVQYLSSIVQNKNAEKHIRVIINAEKYREKREKTLQQLARRLADKCIKSGKSVRLEPMSPYERKVIHSSLQTHPKVTTRSEGVEPNRRVIIELKK